MAAAEEGMEKEGGGEERKWRNDRGQEAETAEGRRKEKKQERMRENESRGGGKREMTESGREEKLNK